nr:ubiquitin carboxyl-terminal hydrolase 16 isoform X2 [Anolis sagrei ordinatus]
MGKKRTKGKNVQSDDLTDISEPMCKHLRKGLDQGHLKKVLQNVDWGSCQDCRISDNGTSEKSEDEAEDRPSIWLCLKCGHRGCGRNSQEKHALKHYETPRSEPHCLVLNVDNWSVWCYLCDNEVQYSSSSRLGQLVDYVRKQACTSMQNKVDSAISVSKDEETKPVENKKVKDHKNEEEKEKKELLLKEDKIHLNGHAEVTVKGLSNLGNTCFYNAVLQNLSQTPVLRELLKEVKMADYIITIEPPEFSITEPVVITLDQPRPLTLAMCDFLTDMQETKKGTVTPKELFSQVCKKAIRFKGYQQQDSQELLRYLLDGMRTEEVQRICVGIFKALNNSADKENEELKKKIKEYEKRKITQTFVDRIFGGELTSTIMCEECQTVSLVHESFLDLSLPVLNDQGAKKKTVEKRVKKLQENEMEDDADNIENDSYLKDREETPGASKHLQKKAKKMAKKQAKNHRRQQKFQEKVIPLTENCAVEKNEADHISSNGIENAGNNSEVASLKQEEKSLNSCEQSCVDQRGNINGHDITNTHNNNNVNAEDSGQLANNEVGMDIPSKDFVSVVECVNKFDHLSLKEDSTLPVDEDEDENEDEDEDCTANGFHKLSLDEEPEDDTDSFSELHNSETKLYQVVNEDPETAFCTLANREEMNTEESSVLHCLYQFTHNEKLCENNKLLCDVCTHKQLCGPKTTGKNVKKPVYTNAKKQMLISLAPPILTLHLKRFQQTGYNLQKVNKHIKFPEVIDLAPFCSIKCKNVAEGSSRVLYSLYGIVEHSGTMRSGHYTAYVKTRATTNQLSDLVLHGKIQHNAETESSKGQWYHISDTRVQAVPVSKVLNAQAYLLFYERLL